MTPLEILEVHQIGYAYADIHGLRKQGCTGCDFRIEGQASEIGNMREIHRAHVAEVIDQHQQEQWQEHSARVWSEGFHKGRKTENGSHVSTWPRNPYRQEAGA